VNVRVKTTATDQRAHLVSGCGVADFFLTELGFDRFGLLLMPAQQLVSRRVVVTGVPAPNGDLQPSAGSRDGTLPRATTSNPRPQPDSCAETVHLPKLDAYLHKPHLHWPDASFLSHP
jgi:hypothetical protein